MPPHRDNTRNSNAKNANSAPPAQDQKISNSELKIAIQIMAQSVFNQNNQRAQAHVNEKDRSTAAKVMINLHEFLGSQTNEDPYNFLDEIKKIFEVMEVNGNVRVELAPYQLKDVFHILYTQWKENKGPDAAPRIALLRPFMTSFSQ